MGSPDDEPATYDVDAERFIDDDDDRLDVPEALSLPDEGSVADVIDQLREVALPDDDVV